MNNPTNILERYLRRDSIIREAGNDPGPAAEISIIDFIAKHGLYDNDAARIWLIARASTKYYHVRDKIAKSIGPVSGQGYARDAVAMFSSLVGLNDEEESPQQHKAVFQRHSLVSHTLKLLLETPEMVCSHPETWGRCLILLQSLLLLDEQRERHGKASGSQEAIAPNYNEVNFDRYYLRKRSEYASWSVVAQAIEQGLIDAVKLSEKGPFCILADQLIESKWGIAICQPLVALYDYIKMQAECAWQQNEAIRLLCLTEVEQCKVAHHWRRLLRNQLIPDLNGEEIICLLETIRESQCNSLDRINEMADFDKCIELTQAEKSEVNNARKDGMLFEPRDPRKLQNMRVTSDFFPETLTDQFINTWPHPEDHTALKILADAERISEKATIDKVETSLFTRLDALSTIMNRPEIDSPDWLGEILNWCALAIRDMKRWYRIKNEIPKNQEIKNDPYLKFLNEKTYWWESRVAAAINRLKLPPPENHHSHESKQIWWDSNDPIACSLGYLDEILAVPAGSRLDKYRSDLASTIDLAWNSWPNYTRGLAITILRAYHWATDENLKRRLMCMLRTSTYSQEIEFSLHHLLLINEPGITDLMRLLIDRINMLTSPSDIAHIIGLVIGDAVARYRGDGEDGLELANLSQLYDELIADHSQGTLVRFSLITSIIQGVNSHLCSLDKLKSNHADLWLKIITSGLNDWLEMGAERNDDLPVMPITSVLEMKWNKNQRISLLEGMGAIIIKIIKEADLGGFYEIHYELRNLLKGVNTNKTTALDHSTRLALDKILLQSCQASAERVNHWCQEQRTTNDLAYIYNLNGENTCDLITLVYETAIDRNSARRELAPVIDILADAGLRNAASNLRQKIRHS